jgi:hypothetical protein
VSEPVAEPCDACEVFKPKLVQCVLWQTKALPIIVPCGSQ